mgnify:CR=1 FL=1
MSKKVKFSSLLLFSMIIVWAAWSYVWPVVVEGVSKSYGNPISCSSVVRGDNLKANMVNMPAIWNLGGDNLLRPYLDGDDFKSWHSDDGYGGHYKLVTPGCIASFTAATKSPLYINARPGSTLIRQKGKVQLYAILPNNTKSPITQEAAKALYGPSYTVRDIDSASLFNYSNTGSKISGSKPKPHVGMVVEKSGEKYYVAESDKLRKITSQAFIDNRFKTRFTRTVKPEQISGLGTAEVIDAKVDTIISYVQTPVVGPSYTVTIKPNPTAASNPLNCPVSLTECNSLCKDLVRNNNNCGACGNKCATGKICSNSSCVSPEKPKTFVECYAIEKACSGKCVWTEGGNAEHCGACGNKCATGKICSMGKCIDSTLGCDLGATKCGSSCAHTDSDRYNCGACGKACADGENCKNNKCVSKCVSGLTYCGSSCTSVSSDDSNCGACGNKCSVEDYCYGGKCVSECWLSPGNDDTCIINKGASNAMSYCTNFKSNDANCGGCSKACPKGQSCYNGACL